MTPSDPIQNYLQAACAGKPNTLSKPGQCCPCRPTCRRRKLASTRTCKHKDILAAVHNVLLEGRRSEGLQCLPFRSVEHAARSDPFIHDAMKAMNVPSYTALWYNLQIAYPGLKKTALNVKGTREHDQARRAAQQILGWIAVRFIDQASTYDAHPLTRRVLDPAYQYFFTWEQIVRNVFLDGGKVEPAMWIKGQKGITQVGAPRNPICYQLLMRTVCCTTCG